MFKNKEQLKNVVITVLVTAQIFFIAGMWYNQVNTDQTNAKIKAQVTEQIQSLKAESQIPTK